MERYRLLLRETGGPEVIEAEPLGDLVPGAGEVLLRHEAIGLNFIDTYHRSGLYPLQLPSGLGSEGAGVVEAAGEGADFQAGERVGYPASPPGAYATHRLIAGDRLVRLPDDIDAETAAAILLKGCTAEMLIERCAKVKAGDWVLVHAAAGGVGSLLVPWLKAVGARVIAHAGSEDKAAAAKALGADHALCCPFEALAEQVKALSDGGIALRVRRRRRRELGRLAGVPTETRPDGELRQCLWAGTPAKSARAGARRLALPHPAHLVRLYCRAGGAAGVGRSSVRDGRLGRGAGSNRRPFPAQGRRGGPPRPRGPADHWIDPAGPLARSTRREEQESDPEGALRAFAERGRRHGAVLARAGCTAVTI